MSTAHRIKAPPKARRGDPQGRNPAGSHRHPGRPIGIALAAPAVRGIVQPKVTIGEPNDRYEREADLVGDRAANGQPAPPVGRIAPGTLGVRRSEEEAQTRALQRQGDEEKEAQTLALQRQDGEEEEAQTLALQRQDGEEEEAQTLALQRQDDEEGEAQTLALQRQEENQEEEAQNLAIQREGEDDEAQTWSVQRRGSPIDRDERQRMEAEAGMAIRSRGPGDPLHPGVQAPLESSLGTDLSEVRVHEGSSAASAAKSLKSHAFTHRNHIWLGPGQRQGNLRLMGHEVAHVLQQGAVVRRRPDTTGAEGGPPPLSTGAARTQTSAADREQESTGGEATGAAAPGHQAGTSGSATAAAGAPGGTAPGGAATRGAPDQAAPSPARAREQGGAEGQAGAGGAGAAGPAGGPGAAGGAPSVVGTEGGEAAARAFPELDIERPNVVNSDAQGERRLGKTLAANESAAMEQQGPAASPGTQQAASDQAATDAGAATPVPENEATSLGQADKMDTMDGAEAGEIDKSSFMDLVDQKLKDMDTPSNPEEMESFGEQGGASELRSGVMGGVQEQSGQARGAIDGATQAPVRDGEVPPAEPLPEQPATPRIEGVGAENVLPPPRSEQETSLQPESEAVDKKIAEEKLTDERLEKANDPRFGGLKESKSEVKEHATKAPAKAKQQETAILAREKEAILAKEKQDTQAMMGANDTAKTGIGKDQGEAMSRNEAQRKKIASDIDAIYTATEKAVTEKLDWLQTEVDTRFDAGEKQAREEFEDVVATGMRDWKLRRYGSRAMIPGVGGLVAAGTWVYDKIKGIDHFPEVQQIFSDGRDKYLAGLRSTIEGIATLVDDTLAWAKKEIAKGKTKVKEYVEGLDGELKKLAEESTRAVFEKFSALGEQVDAKKEELADHLVQRYKESRDAIDARIEEMRAENRGLLDAFIGKLKAVLEALDNFRKKLMSLMSEAAQVIEDILEDPIGFLGNLIQAVKLGFQKFASNIWLHLKTGLMGWLFGAMASMGINLPQDFSVKSIVGFIMEVLGITWARIRPKIVRVVGERNVSVLEKVVGYVQTLFTEGPKGLWEEIKGDVSSLKDIVINAIKEWVVTKIVVAAVTKLVSMFNPAGAIVQAVLAIYNVIMFFVERIGQILELVKSIIGSLAKIVKGQVAQAAAFIERTMALALPVIISFLARLLGIGGIAKKISGIVKKVQKRISKAVDKAIKRIAARFRKLFGGRRGSSGAASPEQNKRRAVADVEGALKRGIRRSALKTLLGRLKKKYNLKQASLDRGDDVHIVNSPKTKIKAAPRNPRSRDTTCEEIRVSKEQKRVDKKGKTVRYRTKGPAEANLVGTFSAQAQRKSTPAESINKAFERFVYSDMPTDELRPVSAKADLHGAISNISRSKGAGTNTGMVGKFGEIEARVLNKRTNYDGGHLIANQFGGPDDPRNLVPMKDSINRKGVYYNMEMWAKSQLRDLPEGAVGNLPIDLTMVVQPTYRGAVSVPVAEAAEALGALATVRLVYVAHSDELNKQKAVKKELEAKEKDEGPLSAGDQAKLDEARARLKEFKRQAEETSAVHKERKAKSRARTIKFPSRIPKSIKISVTFQADSRDIANAKSKDYADKVDPTGRKRSASDDHTAVEMGREGSKGTVETTTKPNPILMPEAAAASGAAPASDPCAAAASPGATPATGKKKFRKVFVVTE